MAVLAADSKTGRPLKWVAAALWLAVTASALAVVNASHNCRGKINQLTELRRDFNRQQVIWGRWLLEEASQASLGLVEQRAMDKLNMRAPGPDDIVVVRP